MSTNPFRRSSLRDPSGRSGVSEHFAIASTPIDIPNPGSDTVTPLSVNTKGPTSTQKHVNFASPPAIPISPVSYPPSPESTRTSPIFTFAKPLPSPTDYSSALQSDPFRAEAEADDNDGAIEQALQNAKANTTLIAPNLEASKQDAIKNTLSKFASAPKRSTVAGHEPGMPHNQIAYRQAMDVDAFKRLLLTGESGDISRQDGGGSNTTATTQGVINDSSSGTDTASISQRSVFDQVPPHDGSPRSSDDIDLADAESIRASLTQNTSAETKKKPPPPAPRHHGKPVRVATGLDTQDHAASSPIGPALSTSKKAPAPPLARRASQSSRPSSSRQSSSSEIEQPASLGDTSHRIAPPPPRSRRPATTMERKSSSDLPPTMEESDPESAATPSRKSSGSRPAPPPTRNSSKRLSMGTLNAPPLPPPRRGRGSSRSSIDSQRPPLSGILEGNDAESKNGEFTPSETGDRKVSNSSNADDILADLAALQREVEEARRNTIR